MKPRISLRRLICAMSLGGVALSTTALADELQHSSRNKQPTLRLVGAGGYRVDINDATSEVTKLPSVLEERAVRTPAAPIEITVPTQPPEAAAPMPEAPVAPKHVSTSMPPESPLADASVTPTPSYSEWIPCNCPSSIPSCSSKKQDQLTAAMKGAYKGVFYANNFGYLNDPNYNGPYFPGDALKGLVDGNVDIGGEFRSRYHRENNMRGLGVTGNDDQFWLTRLRLFANVRVNSYLRVYGEYLYADSAGEDFLVRPIEENRGEFNNLFADVQLTDSLSVRAGRQELLLGAQRLVSPLDWANTRRTFDGYRATYKADGLTVDGFYTNPVNRSRATGGTNQWDSTNDNLHFYGAYASKNKALGSANMDAYYLGFDNDVSNFSYHTLGTRLWGSNDIGLYEMEGGVQFGRNVDGSTHGAGFLTAGVGKKLDICDWKPTVWAWYDWASGGDQFVPGEDGFHHYFPLAHKYNGFMDLFGRRNLNDINFQLITPTPISNVKLLLWYHHFFLDQATTPFSVVMTPYNTTAAAASKELGSEIDLLATVTIDPRTSMIFGYSHFASGDYFSLTPGAVNADADFFYTQFQMRF